MEFFSNDRSRKLGVTMLEIQHQKAHNISLGIRAVHNNSGMSYQAFLLTCLLLSSPGPSLSSSPRCGPRADTKIPWATTHPTTPPPNF